MPKQQRGVCWGVDIAAHHQNACLGTPSPNPLHPRDATIGLQCPQKGDQSQAGALFTLFPQPGTSVPIGAPWGLGAWPVVRGEGLLAGGGPALASGSAPLEEEVDKGLGAVQPRGSPPWPLSLWLLLLPLLLWGERGRDAISKCLEARSLGVLEGLLGALTGREPCCGVQGFFRGHWAGLWGAQQAPGAGLGLQGWWPEVLTGWGL